jgi:peptide/nickel transport system ATP-binding protein
VAGSGTAHLRPGDKDVLLRAEHVVVEFPVSGRQKLRAVSDVSLDLRRGETLGIVGETGCGKSTLGRAIMQLPPPTSGSVQFDSVELTTLSPREQRLRRRRMQIILQDPISSLNPRRRVRNIVAEGLVTWQLPNDSIDETLRAVGMDPGLVGDRRPRQLSGGQCQRVCIARALVLDPEILICDEPVSSLDVSVQAQILNLLEDMKDRYGLSMIFIAHDLAVVKNVSDRVLVMYLGKVCEVASSVDLYDRPAHPYTSLLLAAVAEPDPDQDGADRDGVDEATSSYDLPSPINPPSGCRFRTRCERAQARCAEVEPVIREVGPSHYVACHFPLHGEPASGLPASGLPASGEAPIS